MWRILGALALVSGCLFAPSRPGDDTGDDDCTLPSVDADLPIAGVFPSGQGDMLVRAGIDRGAQRVNFYDPSPTFSPVCATRSVELTPIGNVAVDKVLAIGRMTDRYLLVLVERADTLAAVYQIDVTTDPPLLTPTAITSAADIAPVRTLPGAFVAYSQRSSEVLFGGPLIHRAAVTSTFGGGSSLATVTGHNQEGWYLAINADDLAAYPFLIVGQRADYPAVVGSTGTTIDTMMSDARDALACDPDVALCPDRIARALTSGPASAARIPALSFTRDGDVTAVQADGAVILLQRDLAAGNGELLDDVALHQLDSLSPAVDAIALSRSTFSARRSVEWHKDVFLTPTATSSTSSYLLKTGGEPERLVVGTFVPGESPKILVLDNQPGLPEPGETCLEVLGGELLECQIPAR